MGIDVPNNRRVPERMMLDSETPSHMTPLGHSVQDKMVSDIPINLADESTMRTSFSGVRKVDIHSDEGRQWISLIKTLVVPGAGMSLMSVPAFVKKDVGVLLMRKYDVLLDLQENLTVLGYVEQDQYGLLYLNDDG